MTVDEINERIKDRFSDIPEYNASAYKLELKTGTDENPEYDYIANGTLLLERMIEYDDGAEVKKVLELLAVYGGKQAEQMIIPAEQLTPANFAAKLPVAFRPSRKGRAIAAIVDSIKAQALSIEEETIYKHTGWIEQDGKPVFLHAGGAIGSLKKITVELDEQMAAYRFSEENHADKWEVFKKLATVAPKRIMYPLIAFAALSPLNYFMRNEGMEPAFLMFLHGKTGTLKSTLAALLLSFFGRFNNKALPSSFKDTANSIELKGQKLADVLTVIDDYHPTASRQEASEMSGKAQYLCRSYGDRTGRARLNSDSSMHKSYIPKGNALITGELNPDIGESGYSRMFLLELKPGDVDRGILSDVQAHADRLSECMREFITWIQNNSATLPETLKRWFLEYRCRAASGGHGRTAEQIAHLMVSVKLGAAFLIDSKIETQDRAKRIIEEAWDIFTDWEKEQTESITENNPCVVFLSEIKSLIDTQGITFYTNFSEKLYFKCGGYQDEDYYYLLIKPCIKLVNKSLNEQGNGSRIPLDTKTLKNRLVEDGYAERWADGKPEHQKRFGDKTLRVIYLKKTAIEGMAQG